MQGRLGRRIDTALLDLAVNGKAGASARGQVRLCCLTTVGALTYSPEKKACLPMVNRRRALGGSPTGVSR